MKIIKQVKYKDKVVLNYYDSGVKKWYKNDLVHKENAPAVEHPDGSKYWYKEDKLHREDGPAIEYADGSKSWWMHGELHRLNGPAVEWSDGEKAWWINGKQISQEKFNQLSNLRELKVDLIKELSNEQKLAKKIKM